MPTHPHLIDLIETSFCEENSNGIEHDEVSIVSELTMGEASASQSQSSLKLIIDEVTSSMSTQQLKEQLHNLKLETKEKDIILTSKLDTLLDIKKKIDNDIKNIKLKQDNLKPMKYIIKEVERKLIRELQHEEKKAILTPLDGEVEI
ncbi:hypothetical protein FRACYDRAFT_245022 [Fragilariopsis cylindrus CCMP1102]|uniref:Uncharacterized protein n=1 Tax=Fragilariopsis cylindrus CCMP1102 TaxID=635003 RepID=A0A1E7F124_9STRA|nr:hypothetical protein FRACYDRAFT_245022 [Fragilariopsis cylindrus CCMP1102]|eukprot:OEU11901.1 hypothetical protein FRACYDRAFT_245022 [Fragilariopsis cylindrus CCMP1102]